MRKMRSIRLGLLLALLALAPSVSAQTAALQETYLREVYLLREYGGQKEKIKLKKQDVSRYKGKCDRAVEVQDVQFNRGTVVFRLWLLGEVVPNQGSYTMCTEDYKQAEQLTITGFDDHETQYALESVIDQVLLTPEAYLTSYGLAFSPQVENPTVPLSPRPDTQERRVLSIGPVYPFEVLKKRVSVSAQADFIVGRDGRLHESKLSEGAGTPLGEALLKVLRLYRFDPPLVQGRSVARRTGLGSSFSFGARNP